MMGKLLLFTCFWTLLGLAPCSHAEEASRAGKTQEPIEITARQLEALQNERKSIFTGEVVAKQGDMTLYADRLVIFFQDQQNQVERMEATGNVKVTQLDRTATAESAIYRQREDTLVLVGHAAVTQGESRIAGDEITLFMAENRSLIKSSDSGRVKAVIMPETLKDRQ